jgi:hypothetical protein
MWGESSRAAVRQAAKFSWDQSADALLEAAEEAIELFRERSARGLLGARSGRR